MNEEPKRKRGGQKNNRNAVKHGYYAKSLDPVEKLEFDSAFGLDDIDEEITLLRMEIKKAMAGGDARNLLLLVKASGALERLVRTHYRISTENHEGLKEAVTGVIKSFLVPMGISIGSAAITKKLQDG